MSSFGVGLASPSFPSGGGLEALGGLATGALNIAAPGAGTLLGNLTGMQQSFESLFQQQVQLQQVTTEQNMRSNISKTKHDADMNAVRNMKA